MNVAIMGAGLSGLTCALVLEKNGIRPTIFEKRNCVGDRFVNGEIFLSVLSRPVEDCMSFLADEYGIYLKPISNIRRFILHSQHECAHIHGRLGFCDIRGRHANSFENQLAQQVKSEIIYNSTCTYETVLQEFSHVVLATGDAAYASKVQDFRIYLTTTIQGATVTGDFDRYTIMAWLDNSLAPKGYAYLIPFSEKEANLALFYPDSPAIEARDKERFWSLFHKRACRDLGQELPVTDRFEISRYINGICRYPRIGNTYFTGNCFGAVAPFLGFGQFVSILTGIYAACDIAGKGKYEELTKPLRQNYYNSLVLRSFWEQLNNRQFDLLVKFYRTSLGNGLFNAGRLDVVKIISWLLRPWVRRPAYRIER
ncbi:MAG: NAD(P)/FAD-dependent oxidoreductase [Bacillota bacterium]